MILAGLPALVLAARIFLEPGFAVRSAPVGAGLALLVTGGITVAAWIARIATGRRRPPRALQLMGTSALVVAVGVGGWLLAGQVGAVLALGA